MGLIKTLLYILGLVFVVFTILPAVVAFMVPILGGIGIIFLVLGSLAFVFRLVFKGGEN
jgi:hypothetical protein